MLSVCKLSSDSIQFCQYVYYYETGHNVVSMYTIIRQDTMLSVCILSWDRTQCCQYVVWIKTIPTNFLIKLLSVCEPCVRVQQRILYSTPWNCNGYKSWSNLCEYFHEPAGKKNVRQLSYTPQVIDIWLETFYWWYFITFPWNPWRIRRTVYILEFPSHHEIWQACVGRKQ